MTEYDIGPALRLEEIIIGHDQGGILARWEYGEWMLKQMEGKQLPERLLDQLVETTSKSRTELQYRRQFARVCPKDQVSHIWDTYESWLRIRNEYLPAREAELNPSLEGSKYLEDLHIRILGETENDEEYGLKNVDPGPLIQLGAQPYIKRIDEMVKELNKLKSILKKGVK